MASDPLLQPLLSVAVIWLVAVVTPGPNFLAAAGVAARDTRLAGLWAVAGIGLGTAMWGCAGFFGIHALFLAVPWAYLGLKLAGGVYVILIGVRLLRSKGESGVAIGPRAAGSAMRLGLMTSLSNPKSALFVASVFASALPASPDLRLGLAAVALMTSISVCWYCFVVCLISTGGMARAYRQGRRWVDRMAGAIFIGFGFRLILRG